MSTEEGSGFDLDAYLARIGYDGPLEPTWEVLAGLHLAHATHIPFENLDVLLGRPIRLDLEGLQAKLVRGRRGGYCFEQNTLFAGALGRVGFRVTPLAARVGFGAPEGQVRPRTHMLLEVEADGAPWLADVGFGAAGLLGPVPLAPGAEARQSAWTYRLTTEGDGAWALQWRRGDRWEDLYGFTRERQHPVDYEMASYYTSTHPSSPFTRLVIAQLPTPEARHVLRDREYSVDRGDAAEVRTIEGDGELRRVLAEVFGLDVPHGLRLPEASTS